MSELCNLRVPLLSPLDLVLMFLSTFTGRDIYWGGGGGDLGVERLLVERVSHVWTLISNTEGRYETPQ